MMQLVSEKLKDETLAATGYLLDGYPRTLAQAEVSRGNTKVALSE